MLQKNNGEYKGLPLPSKGDAKTFYKRLSSYISLFDETWKSRIQPIQKNKLQEFEIYFALDNYMFKLPDTYYSFLLTMGGNDGGLITDTIDGYSEISLDVLMKIYDKSMAPYIPFVEVPISGYALFFNLNSNCEIVEIFRPERVYGHTRETFEQLIFRCAFKKFFLQEGYEKLKKIYPQYTSKRLQIELESYETDSNLENNVYGIIIKNCQEKFAVSEEWFSNQDGLITDCYVGTTSERDTVITVDNRGSYLYIVIAGYNPELIDELMEFMKQFCVE